MKRFLVGLILFTVSVIVITIGVKITTKQSRVDACTYPLPEGFALAQDTFTKEYAIQTSRADTTFLRYIGTYIIDGEERYMKEDDRWSYNYIELEATYFNCSRFIDSCSAKEMVKRYQESNRINRFKIVK